MLAFRTVTYCTENEETPVSAAPKEDREINTFIIGICSKLWRALLLGMVLHGRLQKSKIRRREGLKGLQSYIRPVGAGCSSCWP